LPLFVTVLAVPMLGERLDPSRAVAIVLGLIGAIVVVRPGSAVFTWYALLPMGMAVCNALYQILTRKVAGLEHPMTSLAWGAIVGAVLLTLVAPFAWQTPQSAFHWALLGLMGLLASIGHYLLIRAFEFAGATLLAPFTYTTLVWAMLLGFLVFGQFPDTVSLCGSAIIVGSGLFLAGHQRLAVRRA
ncbi:MAG: DMT family transporter, partial [Burkholderiales bacterium]